MNKKPTNIIFGCGYLGNHLLTLIESQPVCVTSRQKDKLESYRDQDIRAIYFDINQPEEQEWLQSLKNVGALTVYFLLPPSQVDTQCFEAFINGLKKLTIHKAILTSSTVVYGRDQRMVDANSSEQIDSERAKKQFEIERRWLTANEKFYVLRLAGIYGKQRVIGKQQLSQQQAIKSEPESWLNLIHVEDAARLLLSLSLASTAERIELGCDGTPVKRREYYSWLAKKLGVQAPVFSGSGSSRGADRQCSNIITQQRTGWSPLYPDYKQGINSIF